MARKWAELAVIAACVVAGLGTGYLDSLISPILQGVHLGHWIIMASMLALASVGLLAILLPRAPAGTHLASVVLFMPLGIVAQDATSLSLRALRPSTTDWYRDAFGPNILTLPVFGLPGWYWAAIAWAGLVLAIRAIPYGALAGVPTRDAGP